MALFANNSALVGSWKLISFQTIVENEPPREEFGPHPNGYGIFTRGGRAMVVMSAQDREAGTSDAEAAALLRSLVAFSGKYHCTGNEIIIMVDVSWNEALNGKEQRRKFLRQHRGELSQTLCETQTMQPTNSAATTLERWTLDEEVLELNLEPIAFLVALTERWGVERIDATGDDRLKRRDDLRAGQQRIDAKVRIGRVTALPFDVDREAIGGGKEGACSDRK